MQHPSIIKKIKPKQPQKVVGDAVQTKLEINAPGDEYEQEADAMAGYVMSASRGGMISSSLQQGSVRNKTGSATGMIMRKGEFASTGLISKLNTTKGGGAQMPFDTRNFMETAFSADFSSVKIHADPRANDMARIIHAKAFTHGHDIYFREGYYNPHSVHGRELLAHELTHVLQQSGKGEVTGIQRRAISGEPTAQSHAIPVKKVQELIDRLNKQSAAISYRIDLKNLLYNITDESALTEFDLQLRNLIDRKDLTVFTLLERFGLLESNAGMDISERREKNYGDIHQVLTGDDRAFQYLLISAVTGEVIVKVDKAGAKKAVVPDLPLTGGQKVSAGVKKEEADANAVQQTGLPPMPAALVPETGEKAEVESEPLEISGKKKNYDGKAGPVLSPEPLMPEPPTELGPAAKKRMGGVKAGAKKTAEATAAMPSEKEITADAQKGVTEPEEESKAKAGAELTAALSKRPEPSPEIEKLCEHIREVIKAKKPPDEDSLLKADLEQPANEVGTQLGGTISEDTERVSGEYKDLEKTPEPDAGQQGIAPVLPPGEVDATISNASQAAPDPVPDENILLDKDVENTSAAMDKAGMNTEVAALIEDPENPVTVARTAQGELCSVAAEDPAKVMAKQQESIANAQAGMDDLQAQALKSLKASRSKTIDGTGEQQTALIGTEEQKRAQVGKKAEKIFTDAQTNVKNLIDPLPKKAMDKWSTAKEQFTSEFRQHLSRVQAWLDDRHSGVGGFFLGIADYVSGLPDWVTEEYNKAEESFSESVCNKIREISAEVNGVIMACEEIITNADTEIKNVFECAKGELGEWVVQEQDKFSKRLAGLREHVQYTRKNFDRELAGQAAQAVQEVREEIHALREAAKGLIGKIADAIEAFIDDPVKFIIEGLLNLVGIPPASFWALIDKIGDVIVHIADDPLGFAGNLMDGVGNGFRQFFDNFGTHLIKGMIKWLFSGLRAVGVQVPNEITLPNIISFFLQLMGFSWQRIRKILAKHIGEKNVAWLEQAFNIIADLVKMGPLGVYEMIKDQLNPKTIVDQIIDAAIEFMIEIIAKQAAIRLLLLFNPVGAIVQAIEAIYKVLKWIFQNAARLFAFIESVVNGMMDVVAGNIAGMAKGVEKALAELLVPIIDFIAEFFSLGDLPDKVANVVRGMQEWVAGLLDKVIAWIAQKAKEIMAKLGFGKKEEDKDKDKLKDTEVGKTIRFEAGNEPHKLWIDTSGEGVQVMMSSKTTTVENKLAEWNNDVGTLPEEKKTRGQGLINSASRQNTQLKQEGAIAERKIDEAKSKPEPANISQAQQADKNAESSEQTLKNLLIELIRLLGGESLVDKYKAELDKVDQDASRDILAELHDNRKEYAKADSWNAVMHELISGKSRVKYLHEKPLGTAEHNHTFGHFNFDVQVAEALDKALTANPEKKGKIDDKKKEYASARKGVIHGGANVKGEEGASGKGAVALRALQKQLFNHEDRQNSVVKLFEYFEKSLEGFTTHSEYTPKNIMSRIDNGTLIITYDYGDDAERKGGKRDFTVKIKLDEIAGNVVVQSVEGNNLALKARGTRGYTASASEFGDYSKKTTVNIHSAHLLADLFMGSGYKKALNLLVTSEKFNTVTMSKAEQSVMNQILAIQDANVGKHVVFSMRVKATWETMEDDPVINILRGILPSATKESSQDILNALAEETRKILSTKQDPKKCKKVEYIAAVFGNDEYLGSANAETLTGDDWIEKK